MSRKVKTARLSIISNTTLILLKLLVGIISGSISIISEAIHSTIDLVAAIIAFFAVRLSDIPPDEGHPYGHEKVENISGVIEAILIFVAAVIIIVEAIKKLIEKQPVELLGLGVLVMFVSALVNVIVSRILYKVAKEEDSLALEADALHLKLDVYTSLGVGVGLFFIWITGYHSLDPIIALIVALFILREAYLLMLNAFKPLMDVKLSDKDISVIKTEIAEYQTAYFDFHEIRTRKAGKIKHIDFHLTMPQSMTVKEAHDICDEIEKNIEKGLRNTKVLIHIEPCIHNCEMCDKGGPGLECKALALLHTD